MIGKLYQPAERNTSLLKQRTKSIRNLWEILWQFQRRSNVVFSSQIINFHSIHSFAIRQRWLVSSISPAGIAPKGGDARMRSHRVQDLRLVLLRRFKLEAKKTNFNFPTASFFCYLSTLSRSLIYNILIYIIYWLYGNISCSFMPFISHVRAKGGRKLFDNWPCSWWLSCWDPQNT